MDGELRALTDGWTRPGDDQAPICPACGVTALPASPSHVLDPDFVCDNPDCDAYGEVIPPSMDA